MQSTTRSREGCWTCRQKKKKCDNGKPSCLRCERLSLHCQGYRVKVLWQDDKIRQGMRRRGYHSHSKLKESHSRTAGEISSSDSPPLIENYSLVPMKPEIDHGATENMHLFQSEAMPAYSVPRSSQFRGSTGDIRYLSPLPSNLTPIQSLFFGNYVDNFSLTYPTCGDRSNPFLSCFVPLALRSETVMSALLALSGVQMLQSGRQNLVVETLRLKDSALKGSQQLLDAFNQQRKAPGSEQFEPTSWAVSPVHTSEEDDLMLLTSAILMVLIDKLSGALYETLKPHLTFAHYIIQQKFPDKQFPPQYGTQYRFLYDLFMYNDLLAAIATEGPSLAHYDSNHEPANSVTQCTNWSSPELESTTFSSRPHNRYYFPTIISRIINGDETVTAEDINAWDGNMGWLPSFSASEFHFPPPKLDDIEALVEPCATELSIVSNIYKKAANILLLKRSPSASSPMWDQSIKVKNESASLLRYVKALPNKSKYDNALLFPLALAAKEVASEEDKQYMLETLTRLETRFQLVHFRTFRDKLKEFWNSDNCESSIRVHDTILLG